MNIAYSTRISGTGERNMFCQIKSEQLKYLGCLIGCVHRATQKLGGSSHLVHPSCQCTWASWVRLRIGANLGHITGVPGVDVGVEAAVAVATLGPLLDEAILL